MTITSEQQHQAAQKRIEEITGGDFVDPNDVVELRALLLAVTTWETATRSAPGATASELVFSAKAHRRLAIAIRSLEDYEAAIARAQKLMGCARGSPEEAELAAINDEIMVWDRRSDEAAPRNEH